MKIISIYTNEHKIELFNGVGGKETLKVDGRIVSQKRSITGTEHHFKIEENGTEIPYKFITGLNMNGISISLYKNNEPVIEMPRRKISFLFFLFIMMMVVMLIAFLLKSIGR